LFLAHNPKQVDNDWCFLTVSKSRRVTTMKAKTLSLVAGMALAANMGLAQAAELDETMEMPEILGSMDTTGYQAMSQEEMAAIEGKFSLIDLWQFKDVLSRLSRLKIPSYSDYLRRARGGAGN
jgi:hypothetical protein